MTVVEIEDISVVRGGAVLLDRVSWRIEHRQHAALIGANGSGKTTLLKILTGYEWPTSGRVRVLDHPFGACDLRTLRRHIGWVSAALEHRIPAYETALNVVGTGFDAALNLYRALTADETDRAASLLTRFGMARLGTRAFGLLSQGEQKRVLIARAMALAPALLILDEPCAGLDPAARAEFLDELGRLAADGAGPTLLFVTHHLEEIRPWIRSALALRAGRVASAGPGDVVFTDAVMSNVFSRACRVVNNDGELSLRFGNGSAR